jgi:hypothetical protein
MSDLDDGLATVVARATPIPTPMPTATRSPIPTRSVFPTRTISRSPDIGFASVDLIDKGLNYALIGWQRSGSNVTSGSSCRFSLRVGVNKSSTRTANYLLLNGINVTRRANRISAYYWQIDYSVFNSNPDTITIDIATSMAMSFGSAREIYSPYGSNEGFILSHTTRPDCNFTFIIDNHDAVTPVSGWWAGNADNYLGDFALWSGYGHSLPQYTDYHYGISYHWQGVTVVGNSETVLTVLVGHGPPPPELPTAKLIPTIMPTPSPSATASTRVAPGFHLVNLTGTGVGFQVLGYTELGTSIPGVKTVTAFLRDASGTSSTSSNTTEILTRSDVNLTRRATRLTPLYWQIEYQLDSAVFAPKVDVAVAIFPETGTTTKS